MFISSASVFMHNYTHTYVCLYLCMCVYAYISSNLCHHENASVVMMMVICIHICIHKQPDICKHSTRLSNSLQTNNIESSIWMILLFKFFPFQSQKYFHEANGNCLWQVRLLLIYYSETITKKLRSSHQNKFDVEFSNINTLLAVLIK